MRVLCCGLCLLRVVFLCVVGVCCCVVFVMSFSLSLLCVLCVVCCIGGLLRVVR